MRDFFYRKKAPAAIPFAILQIPSVIFQIPIPDRRNGSRFLKKLRKTERFSSVRAGCLSKRKRVIPPVFINNSKTFPARTIIFSTFYKTTLCLLIIDAAFFMNSSCAFRQPVLPGIRGTIPPDIETARDRQNNDCDREPFQVDDEVLTDGLLDIAIDFDVADLEFHGNLLLVVGLPEIIVNRGVKVISVRQGSRGTSASLQR